MVEKCKKKKEEKKSPFKYSRSCNCRVVVLTDRWRDIDLSDIFEAVRFRGFQKLAAKYFSFGVKEMLRSAFISLQLRELQKFIPEVNSGDITRFMSFL